MTLIKTDKGLNIPIAGDPYGPVQDISSQSSGITVQTISLDLSPFEDIRFKILKKVDEEVKIGEPLLSDKTALKRLFVSPVAGVVREIRRGLKRKIIDVVIERSKNQDFYLASQLDVNQASRQELIDYLLQTGMFAFIRQMPFSSLANPEKTPRSIFVKCLESAPFTPPAEMQVAGFEEEFKAGLQVLQKLTDGAVHIVCHKQTDFAPFKEAKEAQVHFAEGPHPICNSALHIHEIDPITSFDQVIWTLDAYAVVKIGHMLLHRKYLNSKVISIAGPGILEEKTGYFRVTEGMPISHLCFNRLKSGNMRLISGEPLTGRQVALGDYHGIYDYVFTAIEENSEREFLHFFRLGLDKYSASRAYLSGHFNKIKKFFFSTNQHGERRAFIDNTLYAKVMPLNISTMHLVKAIMAEDYDLAAELGLLEVNPEIFSLATFVCPSKIPIDQIVKKGLKRYAEDTIK